MKRSAAKGKRPPFSSRASRALSSFMAWLGDLSSDIRKTGLGRTIFLFGAAILAVALAVYGIERSSGNAAFDAPGDGIWWAIVTAATVGYGDTFPASAAGRILASAFILSCIVFTALISGTVASIFVERRIREGKGLRELKLKNHSVVCGWNRYAEDLLAALSARGGKRMAVVLVNDAEGDSFEGLKAEYPSLDLRFVRGDMTSEAVQKRASVETAASIIVIPDESGNNSVANADERSILAALSLKSLAPDALVSAEVLRPESEAHLKRAGVEEVVVRGGFSGFLLSAASGSRGLSEAARRILSPSAEDGLAVVDFPPAIPGKTFAEASTWFMANGKGLLLGVLSREEPVSLDDILAGDSSAIDSFIKRKFQEADLALQDGQPQDSVRLNPGSDYLIRQGDQAFILGRGA